MSVTTSGLIRIIDVCNEADWYFDGILYPTESRAAFDRMADYSCYNISTASLLDIGTWYGYTHPVIEITGVQFVSQTNTRYTVNILFQVTSDNSGTYGGRDKAIPIRIAQTYQAGATGFSVDTGSATVPDLVDPDSVTFGTGSFPTAQSVIFAVPTGQTSFQFQMTVPKIAATYDILVDLIRTKGSSTDDRYKIVDNVGGGGASGIDRETVAVPAAPLLYNWAATDDGTITLNPCTALSLPDTAYLFKGGTVGTGGNPAVGDEIFSNNDLNNLIGWQGGKYALERNGTRYDITVNVAGIIGAVTACP